MNVHTMWMRSAGALVAAIAGVALAAPTDASASTLGGFGATAVATGASAVYFDPSAPVPASPTAELDAAYTRAALQSGPIGRSLASSAWPGDLVAGAGPALGLLLPVNPGVGAYPVRAQASYPQGDAKQENTSVPANSMVATASPSGVDANATSAGAEGGVAIVRGTLESAVHQELNGSLIKVSGHAAASNVSILDGLVTIGSVASDATVESDPSKKPAGSTSVVGLTVGGVPLAVDAAGVHLSGGGPDVSPATLTAEEVLQKAGVTVVLGEPTDFAGTGYAERLAGGLVVGIDARALGTFLQSLPADAAKQLTVVINPQQMLYLTFGTVDVSVRTVPGNDSIASVAGGGGVGGGPALSPVGAAGAGPAAAARAGGIGRSAVVAATPSALAMAAPVADLAVGAPGETGGPVSVVLANRSSYHGVPAGDIWLAVLAAIAAASMLWRLTKALIAAAGSGPGCELEYGG